MNKQAIYEKISWALPLQSLKRLVWHFRPVKVQGKGNVVRLPKRVHNARVVVTGNNNVVEFSPDAVLTNTTIVVQGDACRLTVGPKARFLGPCTVNLGGGGEIVIGENCGIRGVSFECHGAAIRLGRLVMFSYGIMLRNHDSHRVISLESGEVTNGPRDIVVGDHVWVCENAKILKGVQVGNDSVVGFGSIVTKSVPPNSIVAGTPARVVKQNITWDY